MALKIWISTDAMGYPAGGHCWAYLNWALGLKSLGCEVTWLESIEPEMNRARFPRLFSALQANLAPYGLGDRIAVFQPAGAPQMELPAGCIPFDEAEAADLLINFKYGLPDEAVERFRRSAMIDIDPGLLQIWMHLGQIRVAKHTLYFTTGETVGTPAARFPDAGLRWQYTSPCVALDWWPVVNAPSDAPFRTVSTWFSDDWFDFGNESYDNSKRAGFQPYIDLPRRTAERLELALCLSGEEEDKKKLEMLGWSIVRSDVVAGTTCQYQAYIQEAKAEFSCAKPSCSGLQNGWLSDRTLCFLASGKPAVVEHTGPSRFLPEREGMLRFRNVSEAVEALESVGRDYALHARSARKLVEDRFGAGQVVKCLLDRCLV